MKRIVALIFTVFCFNFSFAKTVKYGTWLEFELTKKLYKKLELSFIPELRLYDDFTVDKYMFDGKIAYEPLQFLTVAGTYRMAYNVKKDGTELNKRFFLDIKGKTSIERGDVSLRARYTNYSDSNAEDKSKFFRTRLKFAYDIKGSKIKPYSSYEVFRDLAKSEFCKGRFDIGFTRKLSKHHRIGFYYRLQDYYNNRSLKHIFGIDYRLKV